MRYASNNYTGEYRNTIKHVERLRGPVNEDLLTRYTNHDHRGTGAFQCGNDQGQCNVALDDGKLLVHDG